MLGGKMPTARLKTAGNKDKKALNNKDQVESCVPKGQMKGVVFSLDVDSFTLPFSLEGERGEGQEAVGEEAEESK